MQQNSTSMRYQAKIKTAGNTDEYNEIGWLEKLYVLQ